MELATQGKTCQQIAKELCLEHSTVEGYFEKLARKFGIKGTGQIKRKLVDIYLVSRQEENK